MADYAEGPHIIRGQQDYKCEGCGDIIPMKTDHYADVKEYGDVLTRKDGETYREKTYHRFHMDCARRLPDLSASAEALLF